MSSRPSPDHDLHQLFVDTGGTFTDCLAIDPEGRAHRLKVLSSSRLRATVRAVSGTELLIEPAWPAVDELVTGFGCRRLDASGAEERRVVAFHAASGRVELDAPLDPGVEAGDSIELNSPEPAPLLAARLITGTPANAPLPPMSMRLATTRGTNALLTGSGQPPALIVNRGLADLPEIGDQSRPALFALHIDKAAPLSARVVEIDGRLDAAGREVEALDEAALASLAAELAAAGIRTAAVALLHADKEPEHERRVARALLEAGFTHVSSSSELAPFLGILRRLDTAVVDAYLSPVVDTYLARIAETLEDGKLHVMTSAGGLVGARDFRAKDSLLSGPAGGIAGAAAAGRAIGDERLLAFDMGGTSTDVARFDGDFEYVFEHGVGNAKLMAPALAIESVAAGGGSVCRHDGLRLSVGPESAGADPGPACYGAGGPLAVTDVNLLLGRLDTARFEIPIDASAARRAAETLADELEAADGTRPPLEDLLEGLLDLANQKMADAIHRVSVRAGYDPSAYTLVAFGGAGPQHAVAVAERLGIERVLVPPHPGLLSAHGLAVASIERFAETQILRPLKEAEKVLGESLEELAKEATAALGAEGLDDEQIAIRRRLASLRFSGQDATLDIDVPEKGALGDAFLARYREVFGHLPEGREVELVSLRVVAASATSPPPTEATRTAKAGAKAETRRVRFGGRWCEVPLVERESLAAGQRCAGPCLVREHYSLTVVDPGWNVHVAESGALVITADARDAQRTAARPEAVELELFSQRLTRIAEEMGEALRRSAISTNIKERLDFSCAVLDARGHLVVNAPHIPVHLGSLGLCVRETAKALALEPGDTVVTNHPAFGGSHLPDVTLISPVHDGKGRLAAYVASRAHHAELGGLVPGSMPPAATTLAEEGIVLAPFLLVRDGVARWDALSEKLAAPPYPSRAIADNIADLRAALAANQRGVWALSGLLAEQGLETVSTRLAALEGRVERKVRAALVALPDRDIALVERLDDGHEIRGRLTLEAGDLHIDFSATDTLHPGNLNATPAIVNSAVLYVLRVLLDEELPLNEGLLRAATVTLGPGLLAPEFSEDPTRCPAVVGGNVEISQRLVNALLRALGVAAASQGTMNNLLFGDQQRSYYETICGGCGAIAGHDGASAVHSHMTNTRITDIEVLEHRYPVRVERFAIRRASGGAGRWRGGDGVVRALRFLAPLEVSLLSQHRHEGPAGLHGGSPGRAGRQRLVRGDGSELTLGAIDGCEARAGELLIVETPGGGGYGAPEDPSGDDA